MQFYLSFLFSYDISNALIRLASEKCKRDGSHQPIAPTEKTIDNHSNESLMMK